MTARRAVDPLNERSARAHWQAIAAARAALAVDLEASPRAAAAVLAGVADADELRRVCGVLACYAAHEVPAGVRRGRSVAGVLDSLARAVARLAPIHVVAHAPPALPAVVDAEVVDDDGPRRLGPV